MFVSPADKVSSISIVSWSQQYWQFVVFFHLEGLLTIYRDFSFTILKFFLIGILTCDEAIYVDGCVCLSLPAVLHLYI